MKNIVYILLILFFLLMVYKEKHNEKFVNFTFGGRPIGPFFKYYEKYHDRELPFGDF